MLWCLGSNLVKMYLFNFTNTVNILSGFSGTICSSQSHNLNSSLWSFNYTFQINWIFLVAVIDRGLRIYLRVKQETLGPDRTKAGC